MADPDGAGAEAASVAAEPGILLQVCGKGVGSQARMGQPSAIESLKDSAAVYKKGNGCCFVATRALRQAPWRLPTVRPPPSHA